MEKHLQSILSQPDSVLFVGSGVSAWSGLPSWTKLMEELAEFLLTKGHDPSLIKREVARGDLLQAASYGFDKLTPPQIGEFIRLACRLGKAKPHEIHKKLVTLGPRCFITTNYDHLLEESFREWQNDKYFRKVTNRQLTETAEIVGARSIDFLFKLHGDAEDADSIILTREQYRALAIGGELHYALETVQMLQASRPIVYVGFGLRDPDFLYVRDLLANTYKGGVRDHYAIMADISATEADYWRRNYGIHLISYPTTPRTDGSCDHKALLDLLERLGCNSAPPPVAPPATATTSVVDGLVLALARHAARLSRVDKPSILFPLHIHSERKPHDRRTNFINPFSRYEGKTVEDLLDKGPDKLVLVGLPGAGKSFELRHSAARLANLLHERCLAECFDKAGIVIPLVADLKLYAGDVANLLEKALPTGINLADLISNFRVKIYLDAFNEMPREFIENGGWDVDFNQFLSNFPNASIIITSRTNDGLSKLDFPVFCIDMVDMSFVEAHLEKCGLNINGLFHYEMLEILQRPFFFKVAINGTLDLSKVTQPIDIYKNLIGMLVSDFQSRFSTVFDVSIPLAALAHTGINEGEEAIPLADAIRMIQDELTAAEIYDIKAANILNWLISRNFLLPLSGSRVSFFHQSVTEYLAATELARTYAATPHVLRDKLSLRRWDQTLFLTLSLLSEERAAKFLESIISMDFKLALSAAKYIEFGRDKIVAKLIAEIPKRLESDPGSTISISHMLESSLPVTLYHEPALRNLIKLGNATGGAAASCLLSLHGIDAMLEVFDLLVENCEDYNFCADIGRALRGLLSEADIPLLVSLAERVQHRLKMKEVENYQGFDSALGTMLSGFAPKTIYDAFFDPQKSLKEQEVYLAALCDFLQNTKTGEALEVSGELLLLGVTEAAVCIYFNSNFVNNNDTLDWSFFGKDHVMKLIQFIREGEEDKGEWGIGALRNLCIARPDLISFVQDVANNSKGIFRTALLYTVASNDFTIVFDSLKLLCKVSPEELSKEPIELLHHLELDWKGHENLFIELLRIRNTKFAWKLIESTGYTGEANIGTLEIGPIEWWLEWIMEASHTDEGWWFNDRLSRLFAANLKTEVHDAFVKEFNKKESPYRTVLATTILMARKDLTVEKLSEDAISFLLAEISRKAAIDSFRGHLLGNVATETFVIERLLPLLTTAEEPFLSNLSTVLKLAGKRHGRRYVAS